MYTGSVRRLPLLPFERQLIAALGCTEEEYRQFAQEAEFRSRVRPAGYEHIPEVHAGPIIVPILVNLAIGVALSAVSYLLTPKPSSGEQTRQRQLASRKGAERFSPTSGFDTLAELADYGSPVPIIFGDYTGPTGGILASPRLVWSRAFSLGSQQAVKLLFVVGEQGLGEGLDRPDLNGIFLGNAALDAIYAHDFAFYWKRNTNSFSRIKAQNLAYGTRGTGYSGDIETNNDIFLCPTRTAAADTGFCNAFSLGSSTQFGVYSALPNATNYRVNWRTISIPKIEDADDDPGSVLLAERIKVSGDYGFDPKTKDGRSSIRASGQKGVGRNYGRRMGITSHNGYSPSAPTEVREASVGDRIIYTIAPGELPADIYYINSNYKNVQVDDINSEIEAGRRAADDMLQVGETIMIGRTSWVVESRLLPIWTMGARQEITLRCVEIFGTGLGASIGLVSETMITRGVYNDDNGTTNARNGLGLNAGAGYYPLLRVALGIVRNSRACDVTEIGIRSQVWQKANGLCNFAVLPNPSELIKSENKRVQIQSGTMTLYFKRTSVWTMWLRPSGTDESGQEYEWQPMGEQFCITGETPQDQFNFIRIKHPERRQFEFKMVPKSGADVSRHSPDDAVFWRLDAKQNTTLGGSYATPYGTFELYAVGQLVTAKGVSFNPELMAKPVVNDGSSASTIPNAVEVETYLPDVEGAGAKAIAVGWYDWLPDGYTEGRRGVTMWELFGKADYFGLVRTATRTANLGDGRSITILFTGVVDDQYPADHPYFPGFRAWSFQKIEVSSSTGGFNTNQVFNVSIPVSADNPRDTPYNLPSCGVRLIVLATDGTSSQPIGRESAWEYELLGNQQSYPLGHTQTATFTVPSSSGGTATVIATGVVTSRPADSQSNFPGQTQAWDVTYSVDPAGTYGSWVNGALMENNAVVSSGNPFYPVGQTVGIVLRVLSLQTVTVPPGFLAERVFEENSQVNDLSLYGSYIQKSNESTPEHEIVYVNEMIGNETVPQYTKLSLCGLALKASRNFTSLDQIRVWLATGVSVQKFLPSGGSEIAPSNKLTDLVYYLLTDKTAGAGAVVSPELIKTEDFAATAQFLEQNKLFFDGVIEQPTNLRQFISELAPFFLCNFVISEGRFSLVPALPANSAGSISTQPMTIKQLFTSGNIIENSFSVEYLAAEERKDFQAVMRYRQERRNQLPQERTLVVRWAEAGSENHSVESFDMTQYCTSRDHALLVAKFFLSLRRRVTHSVNFTTTPYGLSLAPGDYIRVVTESSPYSAANNGVIDAAGVITAATELADGSYPIIYYTSTNEETQTATLTVADGKAVETALWNSIFSVSSPAISSNVYMIEQLTLNEDGLVDIVATEFPTTSTYNSLIALDLASSGLFLTEG